MKHSLNFSIEILFLVIRVLLPFVTNNRETMEDGDVEVRCSKDEVTKFEDKKDDTSKECSDEKIDDEVEEVLSEDVKEVVQEAICSL